MSEKKASEGLLTPKQLKFVACWQGDAVAAAREAGFKFPDREGARLLKNLAVKAAVEAKQAKLIDASGDQLAKNISVSRDEIINGLALIGRKGSNENARVRAWGELAEIFSMKVKQTRDVTNLFDGWTDAELEAYSLRGELPQRLKGSASASSASY